MLAQLIWYILSRNFITVISAESPYGCRNGKLKSITITVAEIQLKAFWLKTYGK